jgi:hypothetical protein
VRIFFWRGRDHFRRHFVDLTLAGGAELMTALRRGALSSELTEAYHPCRSCGVLVRGRHTCTVVEAPRIVDIREARSRKGKP